MCRLSFIFFYDTLTERGMCACEVGPSVAIQMVGFTSTQGSLSYVIGMCACVYLCEVVMNCPFMERSGPRDRILVKANNFSKKRK